MVRITQGEESPSFGLSIAAVFLCDNECVDLQDVQGQQPEVTWNPESSQYEFRPLVKYECASKRDTFKKIAEVQSTFRSYSDRVGRGSLLIFTSVMLTERRTAL